MRAGHQLSYQTNSPTAKMSDDESCFSAEERNKKGVAKSMFKTKRERVRTKESDELDETLNQYIEEWSSRRQKEVDELVMLKEKQAKRRIVRAEEEKKLIAQKKEEEDRKKKEEEEAKKLEAEARKKKLEEVVYLNNKRFTMRTNEKKDEIV